MSWTIEEETCQKKERDTAQKSVRELNQPGKKEKRVEEQQENQELHEMEEQKREKEGMKERMQKVSGKLGKRQYQDKETCNAKRQAFSNSFSMIPNTPSISIVLITTLVNLAYLTQCKEQEWKIHHIFLQTGKFLLIWTLRPSVLVHMP